MANTFKLKTKAGIDASLVTIYTVPANTTTVIIGLTISNIKGSSVTSDAQIVYSFTGRVFRRNYVRK